MIKLYLLNIILIKGTNIKCKKYTFNNKNCGLPKGIKIVYIYEIFAAECVKHDQLCFWFLLRFNKLENENVINVHFNFLKVFFLKLQKK